VILSRRKSIAALLDLGKIELLSKGWNQTISVMRKPDDSHIKALKEPSGGE